MKKIIQDMWHGRVIPMGKCANNVSDIENLARLMEKKKVMLYSLMDEHEKDRFEKYVDCVEEYIALLEENAFCEGVQFGAKFLIEAMA